MTIEEMIKRYRIIDNTDGRLKICCTKVSKKELESIKAAKPEILTYFSEKRAAVKAEYERKTKTFASIPGVKELREARAALEEYHEKFSEAMERGDGKLPARPTVDVEGIKKEYPGAVFALEMERQRSYPNYELAAMAQKAYNDLCEGKNWEDVKKAYDEENDEFVNRHFWD